MGECWMSITIPHKGFCASQREHFDHPWPSISAVERTCEWNAVLPRSLINETYCNTAIFERHLLSGLQVYEKDIRHLLGWRSVTVTVFQRLSDTNVNVAFSGTVSELKRFLCLEDFVHTKFRKCLFVLFKLVFWCLNLHVLSSSILVRTGKDYLFTIANLALKSSLEFVIHQDQSP